MTTFLERFKKLPLEILDLILFQFIDDIEAKIMFKKQKKIIRNEFFFHLDKIYKNRVLDYSCTKKRLTYFIPISISKGYQIKLYFLKEKIELKTKIIVYNQDMYYIDLGKITY